MSIDNASDGVPGIRPSLPGTKINLCRIVAVGFFLRIGIFAIVWFAHQRPHP